jgi:hypothetical protein
MPLDGGIGKALTVQRVDSAEQLSAQQLLGWSR